ncbi:hypothetical protein EZV62_006570 [Acer yangbiense]|uniref:Uncharacterized protein n=1 Tax=Acer yangbiense TaxID=1000413 RepID=A0A5C7I7Z5_9ROSI|nr:hypothetical protein EZV62_006570 [Acer yangbiense]
MTVLPSSDHPISMIGVSLDRGTLSTYRRQGIYRIVSMNGEPWKAGKFSYTLQCFLWSEHLGLHARECEHARVVPRFFDTAGALDQQ